MPAYALSWRETAVQRVWGKEGVGDAILDQCCFGLCDPVSGKRYKKAMRLLTICKEVLEGMNQRCGGDHEHQGLEGKVKVGGVWCNRTRLAQVYPKALVQQILKSLRRACRRRGCEVLAAEQLQGATVERKHQTLSCQSWASFT